MHILTRLHTIAASILIILPLFTAGLTLCPTGNQERTIEPAPQGSRSLEPPPVPGHSHQPKHSHAYDFLIRGTVFTENALAFPGVQLRVRRAGEKKFHWETYTNSRGEFALRVPQGAQYELVVHTKGFSDQTRAIDARTGSLQDDLVFRMEPAGGKK